MTTRIHPAASISWGTSDTFVGSASDSIAQGKAQAIQAYAASTVTATVTTLSVYVNTGSTASKLVAGFYNNNNGHRGTLLAQPALTSPKQGDWNQVPLPSTAISAGSTYRIAVLSPSGVLQFRDQVYGGKQSETSAQSSFTSLPSTWAIGIVYNEGRQ